MITSSLIIFSRTDWTKCEISCRSQESVRNNMNNQQPPLQQNPTRRGSRVEVFRRLYTSPVSYGALITLSYVFLLGVSYRLGYSRGSSFSIRYISALEVFKTVAPATARSSEPLHSQLESPVCADPVSPELVRQTIIDQIYNGMSPYEDFRTGNLTSSLPFRRIKGLDSYGAIYKSLIQKVQPKTIIKFSTFLGASATHMANLTSQMGLQTQILCLDDFHVWPGLQDFSEDMKVNGDIMLLNQFMQSVISQNATESILPVPISRNSAFAKLCEWGIFGDLIEVDAGHNFLSAWSNVNRAYKLLRPGGVLFGYNYVNYNRGIRQAVRLFAQVNNFHVKGDGQHWIIMPA